jgi:regulator of CtrA degradation
MPDNQDHPKQDPNGQTRDNTIRLAEHFTRSHKFKSLFADGMGLVEESANFLDGPGREAAKKLPRTASVLYASESMRLTTRLMQLASWLLLHRAVGEGEMTRSQVIEEKKKVKLDQLASQIASPGWDEVPTEFRELVRRSLNLHKRIKMLDDEIYGENPGKSVPQTNPVTAQINLLATAFGMTTK